MCCCFIFAHTATTNNTNTILIHLSALCAATAMAFPYLFLRFSFFNLLLFHSFHSNKNILSLLAHLKLCRNIVHTLRAVHRKMGQKITSNTSLYLQFYFYSIRCWWGLGSICCAVSCSPSDIFQFFGCIPLATRFYFKKRYPNNMKTTSRRTHTQIQRPNQRRIIQKN